MGYQIHNQYGLQVGDSFADEAEAQAFCAYCQDTWGEDSFRVVEIVGFQWLVC